MFFVFPLKTFAFLVNVRVLLNEDVKRGRMLEFRTEVPAELLDLPCQGFFNFPLYLSPKK